MRFHSGGGYRRHMEVRGRSVEAQRRSWEVSRAVSRSAEQGMGGHRRAGDAAGDAAGDRTLVQSGPMVGAERMASAPSVVGGAMHRAECTSHGRACAPPLQIARQSAAAASAAAGAVP